MKRAILIFLTALLAACASAAELGEQSIRHGVVTPRRVNGPRI
jgi:hypothetical protein